MVTRALKPNVDSILLLAPAVISGSLKSTGVDTREFDSLMFDIISGAIAGVGNITPKLQESDTDVDGDYTDCLATDVDWQNGAVVDPIVTNSIQRVGYKGSKRYARIALTLNSGTSVVVGIVAHHGHPHIAAIA